MDNKQERNMFIAHCHSSMVDCPFFQPWTTTNQGEINDACVCRKLRFIKRCDRCITKDNYDGSNRDKMIRSAAIQEKERESLILQQI